MPNTYRVAYFSTHNVHVLGRYATDVAQQLIGKLENHKRRLSISSGLYA